jgi:hypothetical protein
MPQGPVPFHAEPGTALVPSDCFIPRLKGLDKKDQGSRTENQQETPAPFGSSLSLAPLLPKLRLSSPLPQVSALIKEWKLMGKNARLHCSLPHPAQDSEGQVL